MIVRHCKAIVQLGNQDQERQDVHGAGNKTCMEVLRRAKELKISDYVFPNTKGNYYRNFPYVCYRIRKKAGLDVKG